MVIDHVNAALILRTAVAIILAVGGVYCVRVGSRLLIRKSKDVQSNIATQFEATVAGHGITFSTGTAGTAVVLSGVVWAFFAWLVVPHLIQSPTQSEVSAIWPIDTNLAAVNFSPHGTELTNEQKISLASMAVSFKQSASPSVLVIKGFATGGPQELKQALAERRADSVRDYLVDQGVPRDRLRVLTQGESLPDEWYQLGNVVLLKKIDEKASGSTGSRNVPKSEAPPSQRP